MSPQERIWLQAVDDVILAGNTSTETARRVMMFMLRRHCWASPLFLLVMHLGSLERLHSIVVYLYFQICTYEAPVVITILPEVRLQVDVLSEQDVGRPTSGMERSSVGMCVVQFQYSDRALPCPAERRGHGSGRADSMHS